MAVITPRFETVQVYEMNTGDAVFIPLAAHMNVTGGGFLPKDSMQYDLFFDAWGYLTTYDGFIDFSGTDDGTAFGLGLNQIVVRSGARINVYGDNHDPITISGTGSSLINSGKMNGVLTLVRMMGEAGSIENHGTIRTTSPVASYNNVIFDVFGSGDLNSDPLEITNTGIFSSTGSAIKYDSLGLTLSNRGEINSALDAVAYADVLTDVPGWRAVIQNLGTISAGDTAIRTGTVDDRVYNRGSITGLIELNSGNDVLVNDGTIDGYVVMGSGNDIVANHGHITSDVILYDGADHVLNTGQIDGDIHMSQGSGIYRSHGGTVAGQIGGSSGDDIFYIDQEGADVYGGYAGFDTVYSWVDFTSGGRLEHIELNGSDNISATGDSFDNTIIGNSGNNVLWGVDGDDTLSSRGGNDLVSGGSGDDLIFGRSGSDTLRGGTGKDTIQGGDGDDRIIGEGAPDVLRGGSGADVFVYSALIHSAAISDGDYIGDFERGVDVIDLSDLITGPIQFLGQGSNITSGSANLGYVSYGGNAGLRVLLDVEGDGTADLMFRIADVAALTDTDFIL